MNNNKQPEQEPTGWDNPTLLDNGRQFEIRSDSGNCFVLLFEADDDLVDRTPGAREAIDGAMF